MSTHASAEALAAVLRLETSLRRFDPSAGAEADREPRSIHATLMLEGKEARRWNIPVDEVVLPPRMRSFRLLTHRASEWVEEAEASSLTAPLWEAATLLGSYNADRDTGSIRNLVQVVAEFAALLLSRLANEADASPWKLQQVALHCSELQQVAGRVGLGIVHTERLHVVNNKLADVERRVRQQALSSLDHIQPPLKVLGALRDAARSKLLYASLPATVVEELRALIRRARASEAADGARDSLWLDFGHADIHLPSLPWEELLAPLGVPVRRISYHSVDGLQLRRASHVLVCCTTPFSMMGPSPTAIARMLETIVDELDGECRITIACDRQYASQLERLLGKGSISDYATVVALDAADLEQSRASRNAAIVRSSEELELRRQPDPWHAMLAEVLRDDAADVIHLIAPGHLGRAGPVAVFSASPAVDAKKHEARFRSASELAELVAVSGASAVVSSAFGEESAQLAWQYLCDELARCVPGTVAFHGMHRAHAQANLGELYRFLFGKRPAPPVGMPLYCHPGRIKTEQEELGSRVRQRTLNHEPSARVPLWLAQISRKLETLSSDALAVQPQTEQQRASLASTLDALKGAEALIRSIASQGKLEPSQLREYLAAKEPGAIPDSSEAS